MRVFSLPRSHARQFHPYQSPKRPRHQVGECSAPTTRPDTVTPIAKRTPILLGGAAALLVLAGVAVAAAPATTRAPATSTTSPTRHLALEADLLFARTPIPTLFPNHSNAPDPVVNRRWFLERLLERPTVTRTLRAEHAAYRRADQAALKGEWSLVEENVEPVHAPHARFFTHLASSAAATTPTLTIEGPEELTAAQMSQWYATTGFRNQTGIPVYQLAQMYLEEGRALGVRGDVAFAQAVHESDGFAVSNGTNNYSGLGACNSCAHGDNFPSVRAGVRAQVELLKAYSDASYNPRATTQLPTYVDPRTLSVRGQVPTWLQLSGTWSTGAQYGHSVLVLYAEMLHFALARPSPTWAPPGSTVPSVAPPAL